MFKISQLQKTVALAAKPSRFLKHSLTAIASATMIVSSLCLPASVKAEPPGGAKGWTQSFEDTFTNGFDNTKWINTFWWGNGSINDGSLAYYSPNNVFVSNGSLTLKANNNSEGGKPYTGGMADTYGKFYQTYGYYEARVKVPKGLGIGPFFSLSPEDTSWPPEINIFEIPGYAGVNATKVWMTNHYADTYGNHAFVNSTWTSPVGLDQDYHTYGLLWQPGLLVWYVDGVERYRTTVGVPNKDCYLVLGLGIGDGSGNWTGSPTNTTFPQSMSVNWVRVWKRTDGKVGSIKLKANVNSKYISTLNANLPQLLANSDSPGTWQTFDVYDAGGNGKIGLKSQGTGMFVTAENAGASALVANRYVINLWEQFQLVDQNGGLVSITAQANNQNISAANAGSNPLISNQTAVGDSEKFYLVGQ